MDVGFDWLRLAEVDKAPNAPGVYAWYAVPALGAGDDGSLDSFRRGLEEAESLLRPRTIELTDSTMLGRRWTGRIESGRVRDLNAPMTETGRRVMREVLTRYAYLFSSPLYVGKAVEQSLRARLQQHRDSFFSNEAVPDAFSSNFGVRVRAASATPAQLRVACLPVHGSSGSQLHTSIAAIESFFLLATSPSFSRR